jgi:prepilin-type N-terminal cleavage/methylation domain-containing protein
MEENVMRAHPEHVRKRIRQAGFSMIEMLMTAFILAIGILGLSMLQVMSLSASRGGKSLTTAVLVAEHVMDQVQLEGRLSWLNMTNTNFLTPSLNDLPNLKYITLKTGTELQETFNSKGGPVNAASADPAEQTAYFNVFTSQVPIVDNGPTGGISDVSVRVEFQDQVDKDKKPIPRTLTMTRRISHG